MNTTLPPVASAAQTDAPRNDKSAMRRLDGRHVRFVAQQVDRWVERNAQSAIEHGVTWALAYAHACSSFEAVADAAGPTRAGSAEEVMLREEAGRRIREDLSRRFPPSAQVMDDEERAAVMHRTTIDQLFGVDPLEGLEPPQAPMRNRPRDTGN